VYVPLIFICVPDSGDSNHLGLSQGSFLEVLNYPTRAQLEGRCSLPDCITPAFFDQQIQELRDYCQEHIGCVIGLYHVIAMASEPVLFIALPCPAVSQLLVYGAA